MTLEWSPKLYGIEIARVVLILWINGNKRTLLWRNYQSRFQPFSVPCCIIVAPKIWKEFNFCSNTAGWLGIKFWRRELRSFWRNAYPNNYRTVYTISVRKSKNYLGHIKYFFPVWAKKKNGWNVSCPHTLQFNHASLWENSQRLPSKLKRKTGVTKYISPLKRVFVKLG